MRARSNEWEARLEVEGRQVSVLGADERTGQLLELVRARGASSMDLRRMSEALAQDPSLLIYGSPEPRPGFGSRIEHHAHDLQH